MMTGSVYTKTTILIADRDDVGVVGSRLRLRLTAASARAVPIGALHSTNLNSITTASEGLETDTSATPVSS